MNKICKGILATIILIGFTSGICLASDSIKINKINVLVMTSYHWGHEWESKVLEKFLEDENGWKNKGVNINLEYLDITNRKNKRYQDNLSEMLEDKYTQGNIDIICTINDEAYRYMVKHIMDPKSSFYQVPVISMSLDDNIRLENEQKKYVTAYYDENNLSQGIECMLNMSNKANRVIIVVENTAQGDELIKEVNEFIGADIEVKVIQYNYLNYVERSLNSLNINSNDIICLQGRFMDKNTAKVVEPKKMVSAIKNIADIPVYIYDYAYIDTDFLGAWVNDSYIQGEKLALAVKSIIYDKNHKKIPEISEVRRTYFVNYPNVYSENIDINDIPFNCEFVNKKFGDLLLPKHMILIVKLAGITLLIVSIMLINKLRVYFIRRKQIKIEVDLEKQREEIKSDFLVNMSHELRTPINLIITTSDLMKMNIQDLNANVSKKDKALINDKLTLINKNAYRLLKLSNNIIDITKIDMGIYKVNKYDWDVVEIIKEVVTDVKELAENKQIEVVFITSKEKLIMALDRDYMQKIVLNLLSNAIKFTPPDGTVIIMLEEEDSNLIIKVMDNGMGIVEEDVERIFSRFYKADNSLNRQSEGCGIGLCLARELARIHGGDISVDTEINKGSTFCLKVPIHRVNRVDNMYALTITEKAANIELSDILR